MRESSACVTISARCVQLVHAPLADVYPMANFLHAPLGGAAVAL